MQEARRQAQRFAPERGREITRATAVSLLASAVFTLSAPGAPAQCNTTRLSESNDGEEANKPSVSPDISSDGRFVAFCSYATNLTPEGLQGVFLRDRQKDEIQLVSLSSAGIPGNAGSTEVRISSNGRFIVFLSWANNLAPGDQNAIADLFLRDLVRGTTVMVSVNSNGVQADHGCSWANVSDDGRYVCFRSGARNLANAGPKLLITPDVYLRDTVAGTTTLLSVTASGTYAQASYPDISPDGQYVCFVAGDNIVASDNNGVDDIIIYEISTGQYSVASTAASGAQPNSDCFLPSISADGRFVAFTSAATNLIPGGANGWIHVYVKDRLTGAIELVSISNAGAQAIGVSSLPDISGDGRYVTFSSDAASLVPWPVAPNYNPYVHDRWNKTTTQVNVYASGRPCMYPTASHPRVGGAGHVLFESNDPFLVQGHPNWFNDVFVRECTPLVPLAYCTSKVNSIGCMPEIDSFGVPSASVAYPFTIRAVQVLNNKPGALIYGKSGPTASPFLGGFLCAAAPLKRTKLQLSGGLAGGTDCSGSFSFDFNTYIASGADPALVAGQQVWAQYWSRDPGFPSPDNSSLTGGLEFTIGP
jgi:hypothetical protein